MPFALTEARVDTLRGIDRLRAIFGVSPSYRELARYRDRSLPATAQMIAALRRGGLIEPQTRRNAERTLRLTAIGRSVLAEIEQERADRGCRPVPAARG